MDVLAAWGGIGRTVTSHSPVSSTSRSPTWSCIGSTRVVLEDAGCRGVGNGSCPPAFRSGFFLGRGLAIAAGLSERIPRRALNGMPRRAFPRRRGSARDRVLHPARVESRAPALLVVPGQLEVVALARHPHNNVADAGPGVEPEPQRPERAIIRGSRKPGEAECCSQESAASVEHVLLDDLVRPPQH
jgi:hypothetical protein